MKSPFLVQGLRPAGARSGGVGDHGAEGQGERHDLVVAHDDGLRAALVGMVMSNRNYSFAALKARSSASSIFPPWSWREGSWRGQQLRRRLDKFAAFGLTRGRPSRSRHR